MINKFKIVIATKNKGKFIELSQMLQTPKIEFVSADFPDIEETGKTLMENAMLKAREVCKFTGLPTIADDSGLEIDAFNGWPGIYSARCAGENTTGKEKIDFILREMTYIKNRAAQFHCVLALIYRPEECGALVHGVCRGELLYKSKGIAKSGLQYDEIFYVPEIGKTLAEISNEKKNKISHRGDAAQQLKRIFLDRI